MKRIRSASQDDTTDMSADEPANSHRCSQADMQTGTPAESQTASFRKHSA